MRSATCPPEYFPTAAWFARTLAYDRVVLDDGAQFSRQSGHHRTRLRNPDGSQYITVPIDRGQFGVSIAEARIHGDPGWRTRHRKALRYNYESAPFYAYYAGALDAFWDKPWTVLGAASVASVRVLADLLRLPVRFEGPGASDDVLKPVPWAAPVTEIPYRQNFDGWLPGMSAIDLLMNLGPDAAGVIASITPGP